MKKSILAPVVRGILIPIPASFLFSSCSGNKSLLTDIPENSQHMKVDSDAVTTSPRPVAIVSPTSKIIYLGEDIYFVGTESYDPEGGSLSYHWMIKSAPPNSLAEIEQSTVPGRPLFTPDKRGIYLIEFTVEDESGLVSAPVDITIDVRSPRTTSGESSGSDTATSLAKGVGYAVAFVIRVAMGIAILIGAALGL